MLHYVAISSLLISHSGILRWKTDSRRSTSGFLGTAQPRLNVQKIWREPKKAKAAFGNTDECCTVGYFGYSLRQFQKKKVQSWCLLQIVINAKSLCKCRSFWKIAHYLEFWRSAKSCLEPSQKGGARRNLESLSSHSSMRPLAHSIWISYMWNLIP